MPDQFNYRGLAAVIVAASLGSLLLLGMFGLIWHGKELGERGLNLIIAIGGALAGGLAGYIGARYLNGGGK